MNIWLRLSATFHEHPKMLSVRRQAGTKADSAELGWYRLLMAAKRYGRWTFASEDHLAHVAGAYYRFVPLYRSARLLDDLTIHDGESYNAIKTPAERKADQREREMSRGYVTPERDTERDESVTLDKRQRENTENTHRETRDPADIYWSLTGKFPTDKPLSWIDDLTRKYGADATIRALAKAHTADRSAASLLGRAQDILRAEARQIDRQEREDEQASLREKRAKPRTIEPWRQELAEAIERQYGDAA